MGNYNVMGDLLRYAYNNEYNDFFIKILSSNPKYKISLNWLFSRGDWDRQISLINGTMFVVNDLDLFLENLGNKGFSVNQGPQSQRGLVTDMQGCLSLFDWGFRECLYNHNEYHTFHTDKGLFIPRSKFTRKNIHMKLGRVRYYTTINRRLVKQTIYNTTCRSFTSKEVSYKTKTRQELFEENYNIISDIL